MAPTPRTNVPKSGGAGKDADGGKERGQFEDQRRGGNSGSPDRPPIYVPQDDGERGGYVNRTTPGGNISIAPRIPMKGVLNPHNIHK